MASPHVKEFTTENWKAEVVDSTVPVVVDFWAPWCQPCRNLTPIIDKLANQFAGKVVVGKVNVDEQGDISAQYAVNSIPRVLIFKGGEQPIKRVDGFTRDTESTIINMIEELLKA